MQRLFASLVLTAALLVCGVVSTGCGSKGTEVKPDPDKTRTARPSTAGGMDKIEKKEDD